MKLAACFLTLLPGFAVAASWTSPGFPAFSEQGTGTFVSHAQLPKGTRPLTLNFDQQCWQPADAIKLNDREAGESAQSADFNHLVDQ